MTNVNDFKAGMKVQCVDNWYADLIAGKEYELLNVGKYTVQIIDESGDKYNYDIDRFEPIVEPTTKANDELDSMPCETVTEFEVGDKIYCNLLGCIETVEAVINDETLLSVNGRYMFVSTCCQATQENYEMLCKLFPHIHFEKPPAVLKGSALARARIKKGEYVICYVSNDGENKATKKAVVTGINNAGQFTTDFGLFNNATPFDSHTGRPLVGELK